jgi:hypothetical protein
MGSGRVDALLVALLMGLTACAQLPSQRATHGLARALDQLVKQTAAATPQTTAVLLHVHAPRRHLSWRGVVRSNEPIPFSS